MKQSTSIHNINADIGLSMHGKMLYLLLNWINNSLIPSTIDDNLNIKDFKTDISDKDWKQLHIKGSPSRKLSDLFWLKLPWESIHAELGQLNIFDVGCGSGNQGVRIQSFSKNKVSSYKGVDINYNNNWKTLEGLHRNFSFTKLNSTNISEHIPHNTNFIISQSAIEHFEQDLLYYKQIHEVIKGNQKDIIQIHLFPSSACLRLYLFHGFRQYTPRTISKITRIFNDSSYSTLFKLGGKECNNLHFEYITKPALMKKSTPMLNSKIQEYDKKSFNAIKEDMLRSQKSPGFYALAIHSNWKKKIFS